MKPRNLLFFAIAVCYAADLRAASSAEPGAPSRWSIERILARASDRTPEIKALALDIERAENIAHQAGKWDNPEASLSYGPMNQSGLSGIALEAILTQNIPLFGQKALSEQIGQQNRTAVEADSKRQLLALNHEVVRLSYRLAALNEQAEHVAHRREKINLVAEFLKTRPFASPSQAVEKDLVLNRLREIEEKFLEISSARENTWRALNVFLSLDSPIAPDAKWQQAPVLPDREILLVRFQKQNPELQRQQTLINVASMEADLAGKKGLPDLRVGGRYIEQTADVTQRIYAGILEFSIPIMDRGGYAKGAALAEKEAATYRLEQKSRELGAAFAQGWNHLVQSKQRVELFPTSLVSNMETQMGKAEFNWKKGLVPVTAFLELENQVHEQAFKVFDAQTAYIEALSQIEFLSGMNFVSEVK